MFSKLSPVSFVLILSFLLNVVWAEEVGDAARTRVLLPLYLLPSMTSEIIGQLPAGTIVRFKGEKTAPLAHIEVELESGWVSGWLLDSELNFGSGERLAPSKTDETSSGSVPLPSVSRKGIPGDEKLLLQREPSFLYGAFVGPIFGMATPSEENRHQGWGFGVGGRVGYFINSRTSLDLHIDYSFLGGDEVTASGLQGNTLFFGFCNFLVAIAHRKSNLEIAAMGGVAVGLSLPDTLSETINIDSPLGLTSPVLGAGVTYRIETSQFARVGFGIQYRVHLLADPVFVHAILGTVSMTFEG